MPKLKRKAIVSPLSPNLSHRERDMVRVGRLEGRFGAMRLWWDRLLGRWALPLRVKNSPGDGDNQVKLSKVVTAASQHLARLDREKWKNNCSYFKTPPGGTRMRPKDVILPQMILPQDAPQLAAIRSGGIRRWSDSVSRCSAVV